MHIYLHSKCNDCLSYFFKMLRRHSHKQNPQNEKNVLTRKKSGWLSIQVDFEIRVKSKNQREREKNESSSEEQKHFTNTHNTLKCAET